MEQRLAQGAAPIISALIVIVVVCDVISKWVARRELQYGEDRWLLDGVVGLELVRNHGIAFGFLDGGSLSLLLVVGAVFVLIWMITAGAAGESLLSPIAAGAMLGGAFGNLIDRLPDGSVTDFVAIGPWPRFNVSDAALTVGVLLLLIRHLRPSTSPISSPTRNM